MELVTLDNNRQEEKLIENYDSLVWAERFNASLGDFQITTGDVDRFMTLLPKDKLISIRESAVPMVVETHLIERKKNKPQKLTIKGRAFEKILDERVALENFLGGPSTWSVVTKTPSDLAHYIMVKICVDGQASPHDIYPEDQVRFLTPKDYLKSTGPNRLYAIPRGNLLSVVSSLIRTEYDADLNTVPVTPKQEPHGIRSIRPNASGTAIGIEIYSGTDRSDTVTFDGTRDMLDDGSYLFSNVGYADTAYIIGSNAGVLLNAKGMPKTGLNRRVIFVDATSSGVDNVQALTEQGKVQLSDAKQTAIFDGSINQDLSEYVYGRDYFLGDTVKLLGDYGLTEKARVTEYIRSEDATGSKSYPTLSTIDS